MDIAPLGIIDDIPATKVNMAAVTIRNLSEGTLRVLQGRAKQNGTSVAAEIRAILDEAVRPSSKVKIGTELAKFGKGLPAPLKVKRVRSKTEAAVFEPSQGGGNTNKNGKTKRARLAEALALLDSVGTPKDFMRDRDRGLPVEREWF